MELAKKILQRTVYTAVGIYLTALLLLNLPPVQRWMAGGTASLLSQWLQTHVEVGRTQVGWNGRVRVDDLVIWDRQQEQMLRVARLGARLSLGELLHRRIRIGNAQLFGMHAHLYRERPDTAANFQFFIDAFASQDTTRHTPLDLRITQLLIRRGNIRWDDAFSLNNLNVTAQLNALQDDSINVKLKRLDVQEERGLTIREARFSLTSGRSGTRLTDFYLALPHSSLNIPLLTATDSFPFRHIRETAYQGTLSTHLSPGDLAFLVPRLADVPHEADLAMVFSGQGDALSVDQLNVQNNQGLLALAGAGQVAGLGQGKEAITAALDIKQLHVGNALLSPFVSHPLLSRLESVDLAGNLRWGQSVLRGNVNVQSHLGSLLVTGEGDTSGRLAAHVTSPGFLLGELLSDAGRKAPIGNIALDMDIKGKAAKRPDLTLNGTVSELELKGYRYRNILLDGHVHDRTYQGRMDIGDPNLAMTAEGSIDLAAHTLQAEADVRTFAPNTLNLTPKFRGERFSGHVSADLNATSFRDIEGTLQLNDFTLADSMGLYRPGDIHITSRSLEGERNIRLISPFLEAQVRGNAEPSDLAGQIRQLIGQYLPTTPLAARQTSAAQQSSPPAAKRQTSPLPPTENGNTLDFTLRAYNTELVHRLLGIPLTISGPAQAHGECDTEANTLWLTLSAPHIVYGKEDLRNVNVRMEGNSESLVSSLQLQRLMKAQYINFGMDTQGHEGKLTSRLYWNNDNAKRDNPLATTYAGDLSIISRLFQTAEGRQGFEGEILPSSLIVSDTLWSVHPGFVSYYNDVLQVDSFQISRGDHFISLKGRASRQESDTLHARLQKMNLEYIFSLINFHAVELTGEATGDAYAHSLFSSPKANAYIRIPHFCLNYGRLGDLDIHLNWGARPYSIYLSGLIKDPLRPSPDGMSTVVQGYITPKKDVPYHGLDLNVDARLVNLYFINKWTSGIFDDLQGRATGQVHIFGPFKTIDIEGDALVREAAVGLPSTGVRYHVQDDSVHLRPGRIFFQQARLYDPIGRPGFNTHSAVASGELRHDHFKNLTYDIAIHGENILAYDFHDFGDMSFYGTVYATGDITLQGEPGNVRIGIKATPDQGTTITYNATSPDKITETPFITYKETPRPTLQEGGRGVSAPNGALAGQYGTSQDEAALSTAREGWETASSDMRIDFDLDIDNRSTMNLLMDTQSGDKITLNGRGHMLAHYYNKGAFTLFGTYRVERGTYNLSLQEVIRKNFEFADGGTLSFNGEPFEADLNLQAVHTISGVSLNDINPKANFSNNSARVNCLMNIGGKARAPRITFDFDILNANEDEKQMVRSLISTEEERNMQVVYLLGIGRFYAYDYANTDQTQSTTAMYSVLSSTLSGTINQALSNMMGSTNWNFGTNLRTGVDGWNDMDVEGMLQGNLLNNRLIINGNFGYRDTPMTTRQSNFIGDFDVKYLLTRSGTVALKAYSETNDRYFTKSSLTTQGIGVLLKKEFSSWHDLIGRRRQKATSNKTK